MILLAAVWIGLLGSMWAAGGAFYPLPATLAGGVAAVLSGMTQVGRRSSVQFELTERLVLAWIILGVFQVTIGGGDPFEGFKRLGWWLVALSAWVAARSLKRVPGETPLFLGLGVVLILGVLGEAWGLGLPRAGGLFENPNLAAMLMVPLVPLALSREWPRPLQWGIGLLLVMGVGATGSRAGLLALAGLGMLLLPRKLRIALVVAVAALLMWRLLAVSDPLAWRRPAIWRASLHVVAEHPLLGSTPGAYDEAVLRFRPPEPTLIARWTKYPGNAESTIIQVLAETGVLGFSLLFVAVVAFWRSLKNVPSRRLLHATVVAMGIFATVHDLLGLPVVLWSWAWFLGRLASDGEPERSAGARSKNPMCLAGGLAAALLLIWSMVLPEIARYRFAAEDPSRGKIDPLWAVPWRVTAEQILHEDSWNRGRAIVAADAAERAVALHPAAQREWLVLGQVLTQAYLQVTPYPATARRAARAYKQACLIDPHAPVGWLLAGQLARSVGDLDRAIALVTRAVTEEPHYVKGWLALARLELDAGRVDAARRAFARARRSRELSRGRILSAYERSLLDAPRWQFRQLEEQIP